MADGDGSPQSNVSSAQQQQLDSAAGGLSFTISSGGSVDTVKVRYPGLDEFEISPDGLKQWLREHNLIQTPAQWTAVDQQVQAAIQAGQSGQHTEQPPGHYNWDEQTLTQAQQARDPALADQYNDLQSQAWQQLLDAWHGFAQQVQNLHSATAGDGETIIQRVNDEITTLALINATSLQGTAAEEFNAWNQIVVADTDLTSLQTAAGLVATAGDQLYAQWQAEVARGNYLAQDLTPPIDAFYAACAHARTQVTPAAQTTSP
jgi:hypothetical protein